MWVWYTGYANMVSMERNEITAELAASWLRSSFRCGPIWP